MQTPRNWNVEEWGRGGGDRRRPAGIPAKANLKLKTLKTSKQVQGARVSPKPASGEAVPGWGREAGSSGTR